MGIKMNLCVCVCALACVRVRVRICSTLSLLLIRKALTFTTVNRFISTDRRLSALFRGDVLDGGVGASEPSVGN